MPSTVNVNPQDQLQSVLYEQGYAINNVYTPRPGVCVLPLAEDPPTAPEELATYSPVVVLRLHAPYRERTVSMSANKDSAPPVLPAPVDAGSFTFVGGEIAVSNTLRQDQLGFDWQASAAYTYVERAPPNPGDGLVLGTPPWIWPQVATALQSGTIQPTTNSIGSSATAGSEVVYARGAGDAINPSTGAYVYQFPSFYPGTFFNNYLVNGGPPTVPDPRAGFAG